MLLVPGVMYCAKCDFELTRVTLYTGNGGITAGDNLTEPCPNGCGPLWPRTWEQRARDAMTTAERFFDEKAEAEAQMQAMRANDWIKLTDRLPNPEEYPRVLIYTEDDDFGGEQFFDVKTDSLNECFYDSPEEQPAVCRCATHWRPLPIPSV